MRLLDRGTEAGRLVAVDGRIACAGPRSSCPAPSGARLVDAGGRWALPGLIDAHVHLRWDHAERETRRDQALRFLLGITTVREAGTRGDRGGGRAATARGARADLPTPRIVRAVKITPSETSPRGASGPAELVPVLVAEGADAIKLMHPRPVSAMRAIVAAAHEAGVPVYGHAWTGPPFRSYLWEAVDAGVDGITHLVPIPATVLDRELAPPDSLSPERIRVWHRTRWLELDEARTAAVARELAARGVWLEPLLVVEARYAAPYRVPYELRRLLELPWVLERLLREPPPVRDDEERRTMARALERMRAFVRAFHAAGGRVVAGTDDALAPGLAVHEELRQLVEAGLSPVEAIRAATRDAAVALGVDDRLGTLEPGKLADFVILEEDPRQEISNTLRIWRVAKGGRLYDPNVLYDELTREPGLLSRSWGRSAGALLAMGAALAALWWAIRRSRRSSDPGPPRRVRWG